MHGCALHDVICRRQMPSDQACRAYRWCLCREHAERKDAITTKIENSSVEMRSAHLHSQVRTTSVQYTSILSDAAEPKKTGETLSRKQSLPYGETGNQYNGLYLISFRNSQEEMRHASRDFERSLLKHIIELMHKMIRNPNGSFVKAYSPGEYLTNQSVGESQMVWHQCVSTETTYYESEFTTFDTKGMVKTSDGREIPFALGLSMSRSFMEQTTLDVQMTQSIITMKDPLVINLDVPTVSVTDQHFFFDIDRDGSAEQMASLGKGSGFLALDKNDDGVVNDGGELFGTESGDGFADLAAYDNDGNGWIDENDSVYSQLKVWTRDENGNDKLLSLKEADVGAIFLGNVHTGFDLTDSDSDDADARIHSTGIFLHESTGEAGTVQHVDFAL